MIYGLYSYNQNTLCCNGSVNQGLHQSKYQTSLVMLTKDAVLDGVRLACNYKTWKQSSIKFCNFVSALTKVDKFKFLILVMTAVIFSDFSMSVLWQTQLFWRIVSINCRSQVIPNLHFLVTSQICLLKSFAGSTNRTNELTMNGKWCMSLEKSRLLQIEQLSR